MVPTAYLQLKEMPMTPNGKTDVKALPEPQLAVTSAYEEPANDTERAFCDIFAGILQMDRVGATDNFFELGGTSLVVTRVIIEADKAVDENHLIVNVEISDGTTTDKTRVVFDDSKSMSYEIGTDANKLMSMAEVPQIYTLDNKDVKYALNTRPNNNNEVRLGIVAPSSGTYTIKAPRMDLCMALKDNATGMIHEFSKGDYTFLAEAGTTEDRFSLVRSGGFTGINEAGIEGLDISVENGGVSINGITDQPVNVYSVKGIRVVTLSASGNVNLASGTYIVSAGDKASKIIVR